MKGLYVNCKLYKNEEELKTCGVMKKVYAEIDVLRDYFDVTHKLVNLYNPNVTVFDKIKMRLPFTAVGENWKYNKEFDGYDFIYFRKSEIDYKVYKLLRSIKKNNHNCKILFEIPTYPYENEEYKRFSELPMRLKQRINGRRLKRCVDRIVTTTPEKEVLGIPVVYAMNGICVKNVTIPDRKVVDDTINAIEVSRPSFWHGYDRFIKGMGEYYKNGGTRKIVFHVVGNGAETANLKKLAEDYGILDKVIVYGDKFGKDLDDIYEKCFVGIDCLGRHRSGNYQLSSLKSREYVAKGLPLISSVSMDFLEQGNKYFMKVPADESPVNMEDFIAFYDGIYKNEDCKEVGKALRKIAEERCDMKCTFRPVVDYILKG